MGVTALTSLSGAPGVTTTAVAWALTSPRPTLVVEADVTGGSAILAGRFRATQPHSLSLLSLASRPAGLSLVDHLWSQTLPFPDTTDRHLLPGIASAAQAGALTQVWSDLGRALQTISQDGGYDVVIDLGRLPHPAPYAPLLGHVDVLAVLARTDLVGVSALVHGIDRARAVMGESAVDEETADETTTRVGVLAVQAPAQSYSTREIQTMTPGTPVLAQLPHNPAGAEPFTLGTTGVAPRRLLPKGRSYARAIPGVISAVTDQAQTWRTTIQGATR